jgi:multidrug resistance efflux pump
MANLPVLTPRGDAAVTAGGAQVAPTAAASANGGLEAQTVISNGTPVPVPAGAPTARQGQAMVKKGSISQTLSLDGLVTAQQQVPVTYTGSGKVLDVKVKTGQAIKQGDTMLELDSIELTRSLDSAQARLQTSKANLAQAQAQLAAQQRTSAQRAVAARQQQQQAITDADVGLRHAQENLAKVMAGPSDTDRAPFQAAVAAAQAALDKATAAQQQLHTLPDAATVRQTQNDVKNAQLALDKAQSDYDTLARGPDPLAMSAAQRDLDRSNAQLQLAQTAKIDPKAPDPNAAKIQHDQAIADAQLAVQQAQASLDKLNRPPAEVDVQTAQFRLQTAKDALDAATARWNQLSKPPTQDADDAAQAAIDNAQQNLDLAQARLDALNSHPTPSEIADAQDQLRRAQAAVDAARKPIQTDGDPGGVDLGALQQAIDSDQADVDSLQRQVQDARIVAPLTGSVVSVRVKPGDTITSAKPVFILAAAGAPIVRALLSDDEVAQLSSGQSATVAIDAGDGSPVVNAPASVTSVTKGSAEGGGPSADFSVTWPDGGAPKFGIPVQVSVIVKQKQDVLVVPKAAVKQVGARTYVNVMDNGMRKSVNVQVGITGSDTIEIVSGLTAGQVVLLA